LNSPQDNRQTRESSNLVRRVSSLKSAEQATRRLAKSHYENFLVASLLLPRHIRQHFYNIYAFCRTADDIADESPSPALALQRLEQFQRELDETFAGHPPGDLFVALANTIERCELPQQPFNDLLAAFRRDQQQVRYERFEDLLSYCRGSANPVGRIVLQLGGCCDEANTGLSDQICTGLQLTNFLQDVSQDFAIGRVYLPAQQMDRFAVTEEMLTAASAPQQLRRLICHECDRADVFLRSGLPLAERVPKWLSSDIRLFVHGGLETLRLIRAVDGDVLAHRPRIGKWKQTSMLIRAVLGRL
jgi:squalene synthase HpnC